MCLVYTVLQDGLGFPDGDDHGPDHLLLSNHVIHPHDIMTKCVDAIINHMSPYQVFRNIST